MPDTWITEMRHFLDESGGLAPMPGLALALARFQGSIVAWATSRAGLDSTRTNVPCRRRPRGKHCAGEIEADMDEAGETVAWTCPACGDAGFIRGWQDTRWDRRVGDARSVTGYDPA